jgi:hypothetical protein
MWTESNSSKDLGLGLANTVQATDGEGAEGKRGAEDGFKP